MIDSSMLLFAMLGMLAGALSGLLGIGGGVFLVPVLVFVFGFSEHLAQGTTLALMVPPIGLLAAWKYYQRGEVDLRMAALLCVGFAAGGPVGAKLATIMSNAVLEKVFAVGLMAIAAKMLFAPGKTAERPSVEQEVLAGKRIISAMDGALLLLLGLAAGVFSGLLGIGGGVILVPALVFMFGLSQRQAQGTTQALMVPPIGLLASMQYYHHGDVSVPVALLICAGFFVGALFGAKWAAKISSRNLARVFGCAMVLIAVKMLLP